MTIKAKVEKLTPKQIEVGERKLGSGFKKRKETRELAKFQIEQMNQIKKLKEEKLKEKELK